MSRNRQQAASVLLRGVLPEVVLEYQGTGVDWTRMAVDVCYGGGCHFRAFVAESKSCYLPSEEASILGNQWEEGFDSTTGCLFFDRTSR